MLSSSKQEKKVIIWTLQFADDSTLVAHSSQAIQQMMNLSWRHHRSLAEKISWKKTEMMYQQNSLPTHKVGFMVDETHFIQSQPSHF